MNECFLSVHLNAMFVTFVISEMTPYMCISVCIMSTVIWYPCDDNIASPCFVMAKYV